MGKNRGGDFYNKIVPVQFHLPAEKIKAFGLARVIAMRKKLQRFFASRTFSLTAFDDPVPCFWSKGFSRHCDVRGPERYWQAPTESVQDEGFFREHYAAAQGLVWVRLSTQTRDGLLADLDHFVAGALPSINRPFVLVTSDGDICVPSELRAETVSALLNNPWLMAWYTQNHDGSGGPKLHPLPIGLDLHTPRPFTTPRRLLADLAHIRGIRPALAEQPLRVFCDIGLSLASPQRISAMKALAGCAHVEIIPRRVSQRAIWQRYASYPFVLSLEGNAVDCHRTWEALYLGSIVITKTSSIDPLFDGLPVVIIQDWAEILDERNLQRWLHQYAPLTERTALWRRLDAPAFMAGLRRHLEPGHTPDAVVPANQSPDGGSL